MTFEAIPHGPLSLPPMTKSERQPVNPLEFGAVVSQHLERHAQLPPFLRNLIARSVIRHIDEDFIAEDPFTAFRTSPPVGVKIAMPPIPELMDVEQIIGDIKLLGMGPYLKRVMALFTQIMLCLAGSSEQQELVDRWRKDGLVGTMLVPERGGPETTRWRSRLGTEGTALRANIDKTWGVNAIGCDFAIALVMRPGAASPTALMLEPAVYAMLQHQAIGTPLMDRAVQLSNCHGEMPVSADMRLTQGGVIAVKQYFTTVRPLFVRACLGHLRWLAANGRLRLLGGHAQAAVWLRNIALEMGNVQTLTMQADATATALKFATNALLMDLVESGQVRDPMDARDLLALARLEGTSDHCFHDIYMRGRSLRRG